ncbi:MAG: hypothetical protein SGARI_006616 [Bacillariaceae sp.]
MRGKLLGRNNRKKSTTTYPRLSPLKEHSPSKPKPAPPSMEKMQPRRGNKNNNTNQRQAAAASSFPQQQQQQYQFGFSQAELLFDSDNTGEIAVGDLTGILNALQEQQQEHQPSSRFPHLQTLLERLSSHYNDDDLLTLDDYIELMASTTISSAMAAENAESSSSTNQYAHVFSLFDTDNKGYITVDDLSRVAEELGEHDMAMEELQDMIVRAATSAKSNGQDDDGRVSLEDFTRIMTMNLFPRAAASTAQA